MLHVTTAAAGYPCTARRRCTSRPTVAAVADTPSNTPVVHPPGLDHPEHRRAICNEIGEQLRGTLTDDLTPLPLRLEGMMERLTELDGDAPSAAPDRQDDAPSRPLWKFVSVLWRVLRRSP